jgi:acyl-CoA dehydrogenase/citronellyl-CoA dehydrogenase
MFELDDIHQDFREVCNSFVDRELLPIVDEAERDGFPSELWGKLAEAGLLGVGHPEEYGGSGGGVLAMTILAEALGRASGGLAVTPLVDAYMAAPHLSHFGSDEQKREFLEPVIKGQKIAAIAVTEPGAGSDVAGMTARAKQDGEDWVISGTKMFITNAGLADFIIVGARTDKDSRHHGITTFIVDRDAAGLSLGEPLKKMGWHSSDTREVILEDVTVGTDRLLGTQGRGFQQIMQAFEVERLTLAGMSIGLAQACLDDAIAHAKERKTFGQPLGSYQAISHRLGEMATDIAAARVLTYQAAERCDTGHAEASTSVAMAKLLAARMANHVADEAVQIFGGYGFIDETRVSMHYRDARILRIGGGTDEVQLNILAKRMGL